MPRALLSILLALSGCASLEQLSSGHIGCSPSEITISDDSRSIGGHTWTATCAQHKYYCSTHGGGDSNAPQVACAPAGADVPGGASAAEAPPQPESGCSHDQHCKGERVCEAGACVDPAPAPVAPADDATIDAGAAPQPPAPDA